MVFPNVYKSVNIIAKLLLKFPHIIFPVNIYTTAERMAAVYFPNNALLSKIFKKANGCFLKDRRQAGGRFVYSAKIFHYCDLVCRHLFRNRGLDDRLKL